MPEASLYHNTDQKISPLTVRIFVVNISALLFLALGLLYTGQYEQELIDHELQALTQEGQLISAALAEGAVQERLNDQTSLDQDLSRLMVRKLVEGSNVRIILFNRDGALLADSHQLTGDGGDVEVVELEPLVVNTGFKNKAAQIIKTFLNIVPSQLRLPTYPVNSLMSMMQYPKALETLRGNKFSKAWYDNKRDILLTASVPVQRLKQVIGIIFIARDGRSIEQAVTVVQWTVLKLFVIAFIVTIMLTLYLSETIGRPIMKLSEAAENVRKHRAKYDSIPNFSYRQDEIGRLSISLRDMTYSLSKRMEAIENFAADVSHEIKNPLASMRSAIETLPLAKDPKQQKKLLDIIQHDVVRMDRLITDISAASRLDAELNRTERTVCCLGEVVADIVRIHQDMTRDMGVNIKLVLTKEDGKSFLVKINQSQMGQVIDNLLGNALSFSSDTGLIDIKLSTEDAFVVLQVENEGPEIPKDKLEDIFERFYSERPIDEKFGQHSGLGLSISRQIVQGHNGRIYAENILNKKEQHKSVRFSVLLPRVNEDAKG